MVPQNKPKQGYPHKKDRLIIRVERLWEKGFSGPHLAIPTTGRTA